MENPDGIISIDSEFSKVVESVRVITNSKTFSTDFLMCQMK